MDILKVNSAGLEVQRIPAANALQQAPIVFLHEGLGSVAMWREWPSQVCAATGRAGVVYSRRGYGNSASIPDVRGRGRLGPDYMHREALDVLPALLDELGATRPILLGHSDGGTIALLHAAHFPVEACIVMAPHVMVEEVSVKSIAQARVAYETGDLRARLARDHADVDCAFWQWNDVWLSEEFRAFDIRSECRRITAPVLALQGREDPYGTLAQIDDIAPTQGPFTRHVIEQCGHSPHRDQPEATLELVRGFVAGLA